MNNTWHYKVPRQSGAFTKFPTVRWGVEIECGHRTLRFEAASTAVHTAMERAGVPAEVTTVTHPRPNGRWQVHPEGTPPPAGWACILEVSSPVLTGYDGFLRLRRVCTALQRAGVGVNVRCGLHVHVEKAGVQLLAGHTKGVQQALINYELLRPAIEKLLPPSRRSAVNSYCKSRWIYPNLPSVRDTMNIPPSRDYDRMQCVAVRDATVEFRQHSGTLNAQKIAHWVRLLWGICSMRCVLVGRVESVSDLLALVPVSARDATWWRRRHSELYAPEVVAEHTRELREEVAAGSRIFGPANDPERQQRIQNAINSQEELCV